MINITFNNAKRTLTVEGHANYAESGKDIVCSAISVLTDTLIKTLKSHEQTALRISIHTLRVEGDSKNIQAKSPSNSSFVHIIQTMKYSRKLYVGFCCYISLNE